MGRSSSFQIPQILPVLQPFGKLLGLGHVALGVARRRFPFLHGFNTCSRAEVPLEPRYRFDTPGEGAAVLMAPGMEAVKESARRVPVSRLQRIGSQPVSSATRAGERDRLWAELWSTTRKSRRDGASSPLPGNVPGWAGGPGLERLRLGYHGPALRERVHSRSQEEGPVRDPHGRRRVGHERALRAALRALTCESCTLTGGLRAQAAASCSGRRSSRTGPRGVLHGSTLSAPMPALCAVCSGRAERRRRRLPCSCPATPEGLSRLRNCRERTGTEEADAPCVPGRSRAYGLLGRSRYW